MDNDTLRRGRPPTLHVVGWRTASRSSPGRPSFAGAGNAAARGAANRRATSRRSPRGRPVRADILADAAGCERAWWAGSALTLQAAGQFAPGRCARTATGTSGDARARKTGALITASAVGGAVMAGADDAVAPQIQRFGNLIGLARFQIVDAAFTGCRERYGDGSARAPAGDAASAKPSYPSTVRRSRRSRTMAARADGRGQDHPPRCPRSNGAGSVPSPTGSWAAATRATESRRSACPPHSAMRQEQSAPRCVDGRERPRRRRESARAHSSTAGQVSGGRSGGRQGGRTASTAAIAALRGSRSSLRGAAAGI